MYTAHEFSWSTEMICGLHCTIVGCLGRRREFLVFSMTLWRNTLCWWSIWIGAMKMLNKHVNCICNLWQYLPFTIIFSEYFIHSLFVFFFRVSFSIYFWCHSFNVLWSMSLPVFDCSYSNTWTFSVVCYFHCWSVIHLSFDEFNTFTTCWKR